MFSIWDCPPELQARDEELCLSPIISICQRHLSASVLALTALGGHCVHAQEHTDPCSLSSFWVTSALSPGKVGKELSRIEESR